VKKNKGADHMEVAAVEGKKWSAPG